MRAGRLRHRVQLQSAAETRDANGGVSFAWSTFATRWAGIEPIRGSEVVRNEKSEAIASHRVILRFVAGLSTSTRVLFGSRTFGVVAWRDRDERGRELEVDVLEDVTAEVTA